MVWIGRKWLVAGLGVLAIALGWFFFSREEPLTWRGVYQSREKEGLHRPPRVVIDHCEYGVCQFEYSYFGHHVCVIEGKFRYDASSLAQAFNDDQCAITVEKSEDFSQIMLSKTLKACREQCGSGTDVVEGPFVRDDPRQYVPSFSCRHATENIEKTICADLELSRLDRNIAATLSKLGSDVLPDQKQWLKQRDQISDSYELRINMIARLEQLEDLLPTKLDPIDFASLKQSVEKLPTDSSADEVAIKLAANSGLKRLLGKELFKELGRPSLWCDSLSASVQKGWVVVKREYCPGGTALVMINERSEVWGAIGDKNKLEIRKPSSALRELPEPVKNELEATADQPEIQFIDAG